MKHKLVTLFSLCIGLAAGASAQDKPSSPQSGAIPGLTLGPSQVVLGTNVAVLRLPAKYAFLDKVQTRQLMEASGDSAGPGLLGLVVEPEASEAQSWEVYLQHADTGYIKDDEADRLNADDLLRQMKEGTEEQNKERRKKGTPGLEVIGWFKAPNYDRSRHALTWAVLAKNEGSGERILNDTSVLLGRQGILICTAVGSADHADLVHAKLMKVGASTTFNAGSDYASFQSGDRISDLTMTGLVTGGAAAAAYGAVKLGLFAKLGKFLILGWKFVLIGLVAVGGVLKTIWSKVTGRGDETVSTTGL
jgi:uncharacterized membrane-anchored protein